MLSFSIKALSPFMNFLRSHRFEECIFVALNHKDKGFSPRTKHLNWKILNRIKELHLDYIFDLIKKDYTFIVQPFFAYL